MLSLPLTSKAQQEQPTAIPTTTKYRVTVYESDQTEGLTFANMRGANRSATLNAIKNSYASSALSLITTTSQDIVASAIGLVYDKVRSHKQDWYQQAQTDCRFVKKLEMPSKIPSFYASNSTHGAADPEGLLFNGFGCQQFYDVTVDSAGQKVKRTMLGLDMRCSLRKDDYGRARIINHGKFEVQLDYFYFNPLLCSLPNDSLSEKEIEQLRTPFTFDSRNNLTINVNAVITSSWMNQAIQIVNDQKLGEFNVSLTIPDTSVLDRGGRFNDCFVYIRPDKALMQELNIPADDTDSLVAVMTARQQTCKVSLTGESFLVPRSYIGNDGEGAADVWGTGQYKIDMTLTESCDINLDYYSDTDQPAGGKQLDANPAMLSEAMGVQQAVMRGGRQTLNGRHNWRHWTEEWNKMKRRRKSAGFWKDIWSGVTSQYAAGKWVYTVIEPVGNAILAKESDLLTDKFTQWFRLGATAAAGTASVSGATQTGGASPSGGASHPSDSGQPSGVTPGGGIPPAM